MTDLTASLFAADPLRLLEEIEAVTPYVESFHLDIMDGAFAPEFGLRGRLVGDLRQVTAKPLDVHLMVGEGCSFTAEIPDPPRRHKKGGANVRCQVQGFGAAWPAA